MIIRAVRIGLPLQSTRCSQLPFLMRYRIGIRLVQCTVLTTMQKCTHMLRSALSVCNMAMRI